MLRTSLHAAAIVFVLAVVALLAPVPAESNRNFYEHSGREGLMPDCQGGDCFRPLIPMALERLPGSSLLKWKTYAVIANAIGAIAVGHFSLLLGLSATGAVAAMWLSAVGAGTFYSLYDCYSSDPLMYLIGPVMAVWIWRGRYLRAGLLGVVGVFAKEFAAAPLWIFALWAAVERRWHAAIRLLFTATAVTLVWLATHASFMVLENYAYGSTASADLLHGGFLATWLRSVRVTGAAAYLFTSFSAAYLLWPVGLVRGPRRLQLLALAALPALLALVYVEQPERALWNFHFIFIPLAAMVLQELPGWMIGVFVGCFGVANLRFGAQFAIRGPARVALVIALAIAAIAAIAAMRAFRRAGAALPGEWPAPMNDPLPPLGAWTFAGGAATVFALLVATLFDVRAHRQSDGRFGVNQWGFRGTQHAALHQGVRIAVVGGSAAFAARTPWGSTVPAQLASDLNARLGLTRPGEASVSAVSLAEPGAGAGAYAATLHDYASLQPHIVCIYDGYDAVSSPGLLGRHRSIVFRAIGYLPRSPMALLQASDAGSSTMPDVDPLLRDAPGALPDVSCAGASASYCAAMAETVRAAFDHGRDVVVVTPPYVSARHEAQQQSLAAALTAQFAGNPRFHYLNVGRAIDLRDPSLADGAYPTPAGARAIATRLAEGMLEVVRARLQYFPRSEKS